MNERNNQNQMLNSLRLTAQKVMPKGGKVFLYGSRAKGTATEESDWDLLLLVDKQSLDENDFNDIAYPFVLTGWKSGADVSPQLYTYNEWKEREITPYYQNVEHDKIVIYES